MRTVEYAFKKVKQLQLFKDASLNRLEWPHPQTHWYIETFRCLTCIRDSFKSPESTKVARNSELQDSPL